MTPTPTTANLATVDIPEAGPSRRIESEGIDLDDVARRVKELILENEELGELVLDAGRSTEPEWQVLIDGEQWIGRDSSQRTVLTIRRCQTSH